MTDYKYFNLGKHWNSKIKSVFESAIVQKQLVKDFGKYVKGRQQYCLRLGGQYAFTENYSKKDRPIKYDSSDWRVSRKGRPYSFDEYVCTGACHWVVNSLLLTARIAYPEKPWVIVNGENHSTVWDQHLTFFDMNYLAKGVSVEDCAINTVLDPFSVILAEGELLRIGITSGEYSKSKTRPTCII